MSRALKKQLMVMLKGVILKSGGLLSKLLDKVWKLLGGKRPMPKILKILVVAAVLVGLIAGFEWYTATTAAK